MFEPTKNDGYYQLGLEAAAVIRQAVLNRRPVVPTTVVEPVIDTPMKEADTSRNQPDETGTGDGGDLLL